MYTDSVRNRRVLGYGAVTEEEFEDVMQKVDPPDEAKSVYTAEKEFLGLFSDSPVVRKAYMTYDLAIGGYYSDLLYRTYEEGKRAGAREATALLWGPPQA